MWPLRSARLAVLALLFCLSAGVEADEAQATDSSGRVRRLRKEVRRARPVRGARDSDYLENLEIAFRGNTYRELDDKGDNSAGEARRYDARDNDPGADNSFRAYGRPYNFDNDDAVRGSLSDSDAGSSAPARARGGSDAGSSAPARARGGSAGLSRSATDSQRWLKLLAEFLKTSAEGRELLRAQPGDLQVGGADGGLPLPVLLVPVAAAQCAASNPAQPPPADYLPPYETTDLPVTPDSANVRHAPDRRRAAELVAQLRAQRPRAPLLPPLLLPESPAPAPPAPPPPPPAAAPPPARLSFPHSLLIRAELTVYYADYTEPYTVWYDAQTGSSRVDMHGGTTVLYRTVLPNGEVERLQLTIERYEDEERRRCARLTSGVTPADRSPPGLPDPEPFRFDGYAETPDGRMERWTYVLAGQVGELGAARGEALAFRHSLLVARARDDLAVPYAYRVSVDSSLLGAAVDWHEHRYLEVRAQQPDARYMRADAARDCDASERAARLERVDPLREFVMTHRDTRCDAHFDKFKETFDVKYESVEEEAVRKTLLIRSLHFVESANRQGSSALLEVNELSVLLDFEKSLLQGLEDDGEGEEGEADEEGEVGAAPPAPRRLQPEPFPYSAAQAAALAAQLPAAFSWKRQGAVTHVRNQGLCKTCWAFAVVAAVEGALFLRTHTLAALSERQLVECARGRCTRGKHVDRPYQLIKEMGIAALTNYSRYNYEDPMFDQCKPDAAPVTKISGFVRVSNSADALKVAITRHGPTVVEVDSSCGSFQYFKAGVVRDERCARDARNHAIAAVGFGRHKRYGDYFIAKNSWGLAGRRGYVHLHARSNAAGVHTAPSYPLLAAADVPRAPRASPRLPDERSIFDTDAVSMKQYAADRRKFLADRKKQTQKQRRL